MQHSHEAPVLIADSKPSMRGEEASSSLGVHNRGSVHTIRTPSRRKLTSAMVPLVCVCVCVLSTSLPENVVIPRDSDTGDEQEGLLAHFS